MMLRTVKKTGLIAALVALALSASLLLAGCSGGSDQAKELDGGSTTYFYAESMDPANNWDGWEMQYYGITENLLKLTDDFEVEPWLAESCDMVDETTWKLVLRDDVTFSNGEKMTADAVKKCFERTYQLNARAADTLAIASIEADGQTLTITTKEPVPSFKNIICDPVFSVYYVGDDVDYATYTPCTGPYEVEEFVYEDHTTLIPNGSYWGGEPKLDRIVLKTFFDDDSQTMAMQNGEVNILAMPGTSSYQTLNDAAKYQVLSKTSTRADFVRFNMDSPVVSNEAVRLAVSYCIDREGYASTICAGNEVPSYGVYSSQLPYGGTDGLNPTVTSLDIDAAKAALDKAGIVDGDGDGVREMPDGSPCQINLFNCSAYNRFVLLADDLQSKLAQAGVKLNITTVDYWLQDTDTYNKDNPDMTIDSYGMAPTGDASYFATMSFKSDGSNNFGHYANPEVDALITQLNSTFDQDKRDDLTRQISQHVLDDNAYIFFANAETAYIADTSVKDVAVAPSEYYFITKDTTVE